MTLEQIKEELAHLSAEQQDQVIAYVVHLRHMRDPLARQELARKIDDQDSSHWLPLDELRAHWKD